jgi:hypothetical protein
MMDFLSVGNFIPPPFPTRPTNRTDHGRKAHAKEVCRPAVS